MNLFIEFFYITLYRPLVNILILLFTYLPGHDLGVAVILLTLLIKLILHPITKKGLKSQQAMARLQPKMKEIQEKYKHDRAAQSQAMMALYKQEGVSPASGCLPLLLQLPIIIALYQVFLRGLSSESLSNSLYTFVPHPGVIAHTFLGFNLEAGAFVIAIAIIAGVAQFVQAKLTNQNQKTQGQKSKGGDFAKAMQTQMLYFFPIITVVIIWKFGAVIGLYWLTSTLFSIGEQLMINRKNNNLPNSTTTIKAIQTNDGQKTY